MSELVVKGVLRYATLGCRVVEDDFRGSRQEHKDRQGSCFK